MLKWLIIITFIAYITYAIYKTWLIVDSIIDKHLEDQHSED